MNQRTNKIITEVSEKTKTNRTLVYIILKHYMKTIARELRKNNMIDIPGFAYTVLTMRRKRWWKKLINKLEK